MVKHIVRALVATSILAGCLTRPVLQENPTTHRTIVAPVAQTSIDKVDCAKLPDNVGECDGDKFYFCDDKQLWVTDCKSEAKMGGATDGSCYEGEKFVDCLGCGQTADGTHVCCDFSKTVCCADDGACYSPK